MRGRRKPSPLATIDRRTFLRAASAAAAGLVVPSPWLIGCGDGGGGKREAAVPFTVDPNVPWWLQNNFDPVFDERDEFDLAATGSIPPELNGVYVRNGSNPQSGDSVHWFLGDGMLHGVRLESGRALWYRNRYVRTPLYEQGIDFRDGVFPVGGNNQSNVSPIFHAGRLLTSGEVGAPYEIDPADLSTIGVHDFDGALNTSFTAHSKIDPATGWLHFFGYWFFPPFLTYHVADETGRVVSSEEVEIPASTMMHSFAITERDVVFWDLPVVLDLEAGLRGEWPFAWDAGNGARIGVMPLGGPASEIRWVEIEPCYVFHELNAFRDGDEVVVDVCRYPRMMDGERFGDLDLQLHRWRIDTGGETLAFRDEVLEDRRLEFPFHDRRFTGRPNRYGWFVEARNHPAGTIDQGGVIRLDHRTGDVRQWDPGPNKHCGETFFVAGGAGEGEGWLLTFVYDHAANASDLVVLDALRVHRGPVAEIHMPRRVPYGFHGVWVPG